MVKKFIATIAELLPEGSRLSATALLDRGYPFSLKLDTHDVYNTYHWFIGAFDALQGNQVEYLDFVLNRVKSASRNLIMSTSGSLRHPVVEKLRGIKGITFVVCEGRLKYILANNTEGWPAVDLGSDSATISENAVLNPKVNTVEHLLGIIEDMEVLADE